MVGGESKKFLQHFDDEDWKKSVKTNRTTSDVIRLK